MHEMEQQIRQSAERLFLHYGFRKTSVDQIAREAGIGKGTIYNYFRNKEELFARCAEHWREAAEDYLKQNCDPNLPLPERWIQRITLRLQFIRRMIGVSLVTETTMKELVEATFLLSNQQEQMLTEILNMVEEGQGIGQIRPDLETEKTVRLLLQMEKQWVPRWLTLEDWDTVCDEARQLHELVWYGLKAPES